MFSVMPTLSPLGSSSPMIRKQQKFDPPPKDPPPSLPAKSPDNLQPTSSSSPRPSRKWIRETPASSQEPEEQQKRTSPHFGRKFGRESPKVEESVPLKRDSPSLRRNVQSEKPKAEEPQDEQEKSPAAPKQFVYKLVSFALAMLFKF